MDNLQVDAFLPHGMCYMWRWDMLILHVGSDILIALAYFSIPAAMIVLMRNRPDVPKPIFRLFVAFILLCGITHLISVVVVWEPIYLIQGLAKLATAGVSIATAIVLWPLIPRAIAMPSVRDLETRNMEIDALNARLRDRLDSLSTLAGGVSHEFNNLLTVISGNVELLQMDETDPEKLLKYQAIDLAARRCTDTCAKMLAYSGKGHFVLEEVDLGSLLGEINLSEPENCSVTINKEPGLPPVNASRRQMTQLIHSLFDNAVEGIADSPRSHGHITLSIGRQELDSGQLARSAFECDARAGEFIVLEIADNGIGMDQSTREHMFDPYFSTKFTGRGLGLAAVQGIVRGHDGCLFVNSEPGKGTSIRLALPVAAALTEQYRPPKCEQPQTVLVVDDEQAVLDLARSYLEELGMTVLTAGDSASALALVKTYGQQIDALILDFLMPNETGLQLLDKISRVIEVDTYLTSGFTRGEIGDSDIRQLLTGFIAKPFSYEDMRAIFGSRAIPEPNADE